MLHCMAPSPVDTESCCTTWHGSYFRPALSPAAAAGRAHGVAHVFKAFLHSIALDCVTIVLNSVFRPPALLSPSCLRRPPVTALSTFLSAACCARKTADDLGVLHSSV